MMSSKDEYSSEESVTGTLLNIESTSADDVKICQNLDKSRESCDKDDCDILPTVKTSCIATNDGISIANQNDEKKMDPTSSNCDIDIDSSDGSKLHITLEIDKCNTNEKNQNCISDDEDDILKSSSEDEDGNSSLKLKEKETSKLAQLSSDKQGCGDINTISKTIDITVEDEISELSSKSCNELGTLSPIVADENIVLKWDEDYKNDLVDSNDIIKDELALLEKLENEEICKEQSTKAAESIIQDKNTVLKCDDACKNDLVVNDIIKDELALLEKLEKEEIHKELSTKAAETIEIDDLIDSDSVCSNKDLGNEIDEAELLKDPEECGEIIKNAEIISASTSMKKKSLKDPNAMLDIPMDLDLIDNEFISPCNVKQSEKSIGVQNVIPQISSDDEEMLLKDEPDIMASNVAENENIEVIDLDNDSDTSLTDKHVITEQEELKNAIQEIEAELKEPETDTTICVKVLGSQSTNEATEILENIKTDIPVSKNEQTNENLDLSEKNIKCDEGTLHSLTEYSKSEPITNLPVVIPPSEAQILSTLDQNPCSTSIVELKATKVLIETMDSPYITKRLLDSEIKEDCSKPSVSPSPMDIDEHIDTQNQLPPSIQKTFVLSTTTKDESYMNKNVTLQDNVHESKDIHQSDTKLKLLTSEAPSNETSDTELKNETDLMEIDEKSCEVKVESKSDDNEPTVPSSEIKENLITNVIGENIKSTLKDDTIESTVTIDAGQYEMEKQAKSPESLPHIKTVDASSGSKCDETKAILKNDSETSNDIMEIDVKKSKTDKVVSANMLPKLEENTEQTNLELSEINEPTQSSEVVKKSSVDENLQTASTVQADKTPTDPKIKTELDSAKSSEAEPIPSTSKDKSEDTQDTSDSLGLLAESSRIVEEDEEQEEEENDDGDDEEDFEPDDESSNQMTIEHSEDSNTVQSEVENKDTPQPKDVTEQPFNFTPKKIEEKDETDENTNDGVNDNEDMVEEVTVATEDSIDIETFKLSDNSDNEESKTKEEKATKEETIKDETQPMDTVDLDSDEDTTVKKATPNVTSVNLPADIDVIASHSLSVNSDIVTKEGEIIISGIPKPSPVKVARINTGEVSIKKTKSKPLEVFNLDSDDEIEDEHKEPPAEPEEPPKEPEPIPEKKRKKCVNESCPKTCETYFIADSSITDYFNAKGMRYVCEDCAKIVELRNTRLINGIRNLEDLLSLDLSKDFKDPIEVLDSDSEEEVDPEDLKKQVLGLEGAKLVEEQLADMINAQWETFKMDSRLMDSVEQIKNQMADLEKESKEVEEMLKECQISTDKFRNELYATFQPDIKHLPGLTIVDTPDQQYIAVEATMPSRQSKRRKSPTAELPSKRKAVSPESEQKTNEATAADDDNTDITVVQLSTENAPPDLPPPGEVLRPPLCPGMQVYAMRNMFGTWARAQVIEVGGATNSPYSMCRIKFNKVQKTNNYKTLNARWLAYCEPANARMTIGTRVIALFQGSTGNNSQKQGERFYSGIVAETPNPVNQFRYLIFFDDGYAQYARHGDTRLVCEYSLQVWEEVHPFSRLFVKEYLLNYPQRPMVRLRAGQTIRTEWKDKWWPSKVVKVDASLVQVQFLGEAHDRLEWIYRGSTRLEPLYREMKAAERQRPRAMPRAQAHARPNMPIVEYTRSEEQMKAAELQNIRELNNEELRRQRSVAKKSTTSLPQPPPKLDNFSSRVVYYSPKNAVKPHKITKNHICSPNCKRTDVLPLKDLKTYNPLAKPLLSGWERQIVRWKYDKRVMYRAPCGLRIRNMAELHRYLQTIESDMGVDLFDFEPNTHCLAEFVINKCIVSKKDLSHGKENVPVPCVNYYDDSLPEFCSYNTERTPTAGVPLNLDPEFLCGCDCDDDCQDKSKCACWKMTLEGARTIGYDDDNVGYVYKRLPEPLPSGIYECNSRCKCKSTCLNRVAQHPLQLKLQVFKTLNRGWGIRALNDVPKGAFLCIYAGNLLTDATANLDGLNEGDEYLAELDYIEVVEQMKEGFEEDIPDSIKALDKKESENTPDESEIEEEEEENEKKEEKYDEDDDFKPIGYQHNSKMEFNKRLRKRKKKDKQDEKQKEADKDKNKSDCITISDDEETVREPSRFTAEIGENDRGSKYKSVRTLFGEDEACYIMDAKVQGNIGRYLNHSCSPNVFVQNVFVDTHDPRFPWVAFFALTHIKAGKELTWNYNYDVGSVPGKVLDCHCGEPNCRGRLL